MGRVLRRSVGNDVSDVLLIEPYEVDNRGPNERIVTAVIQSDASEWESFLPFGRDSANRNHGRDAR